MFGCAVNLEFVTPGVYINGVKFLFTVIFCLEITHIGKIFDSTLFFFGISIMRKLIFKVLLFDSQPNGRNVAQTQS